MKFLSWLKANSIASKKLILQALIDMEMSHKEFISILRKKINM